METKPILNEDHLESKRKVQVWDYDKSVEKVKSLILKRKNLTIDILRELYIARQLLSASGARNDLAKNLDRSKKGFKHYCEEVGVSRETIRLWLKEYDPDKNLIRKLTPESDNTKILNDENYQGVGGGYSGDGKKNINLAYIAGIPLKCSQCGNEDYSRTFEEAVNEEINRVVSIKVKELLKQKKK